MLLVDKALPMPREHQQELSSFHGAPENLGGVLTPPHSPPKFAHVLQGGVLHSVLSVVASLLAPLRQFVKMYSRNVMVAILLGNENYLRSRRKERSV